jgi:hypothetical protein
MHDLRRAHVRGVVSACPSIHPSTNPGRSICGQIALRLYMVNIKYCSNLPDSMSRLCNKLVTSQSQERCRYMVSKRVTLFNCMIADQISWARRKLNTLEIVANRLPSGIMCKITNGRQMVTWH